ncbi:MAG: PDZ domain-containing protein [Bryobacteraceae bacterium]|nr:PDZ domain-containing protein [Bryobacteraceae bacterium]
MEPIQYTLRFPNAAQHYVDVTAVVPTGGAKSVELMMAVWTPGSYLVREYARHVERFTAPGKWEKSRKNRWRVETGGERTVTVQYRVYARELSVRTNFVEAGFASLNGAPTFLTLVEKGAKRPHEVRLELPRGWNGSYSGMTEVGPNHFRAADYDELVDCPILAGSPAVHQFTVAGKKHYLVNEGEAGIWNGPESAAAVEKIVREYERMMGGLPYEKYVFINLIAEAGGGLEHKNSTVLIASRWAWRNTAEPAADGGSGPSRPNRIRWLDLVSHEYFHLWNVKRLRPVELGPFDYEQENHTTGLWVAEGFTSYYGPLAPRRAGLYSRDVFLRLLSNEIRDVQTTPGRLEQSMERSSYDAWIKYYRPDENSKNTGMSYYTKGALIAWLLDAKIRKATGGSKSLDSFMKAAYEKFGGEKGFTAAQFRKLASEVAGQDLNAWFRHAVETTGELDYTEALDYFGLRFKEDRPSNKAAIGATTRTDNGRLLVATVPRESAAWSAGLNVDDEILAINGFRVRADGLTNRLEAYAPGDKVELLIARRDRLMTLPLELKAESRKSWQLEVRPDASEAQRAALRDWLRE